MVATQLSEAVVSEFGKSLRGDLIQPNDTIVVPQRYF